MGVRPSTQWVAGSNLSAVPLSGDKYMYLGQVARSFTKQYNLVGYKLKGGDVLRLGR